MAESVANQNSPSHNARENQATQSRTQTVMEEATTSQQASTTVQLRLPQQREEHRVKWTEDTVDNEFMGKKKSKCCCIYEKPKLFGESSTSEEEEDDGDGCTPHCRGHKKKCYRHKKTPHCEDNDGCDHSDDAEGMPPDGATPT